MINTRRTSFLRSYEKKEKESLHIKNILPNESCSTELLLLRGLIWTSSTYLPILGSKIWKIFRENYYIFWCETNTHPKIRDQRDSALSHELQIPKQLSFAQQIKKAGEIFSNLILEDHLYVHVLKNTCTLQALESIFLSNFQDVNSSRRKKKRRWTDADIINV